MTENNESPLTFPCDFPIKVFGVANDEFEILVTGMVRKHIPDIDETVTRTRLSQDGKYISVTLLVTVDSKEKLDAIYQELTSNPLVLMAI